jgi:large subunit ribosomal protein L44e
MVKFPSVIRAYCPSCRRHTEHIVEVNKTKARRKLSKGQRRAERHKKGYGNKGKYSKKAITQTKMASKTSKKVDLRLKCKDCGKMHPRSYPRNRKFEIVKVV